MIELKKTFRLFTILNHEKEEEYLNKMHKKGWKLVKVSKQCIYTFEKCEPEDVVYQLDYNQEAEQNPDEYVKLFEDCGWEFILFAAGFSYFRKRRLEMSGEREEIFNDNISKKEMLNRLFFGRIMPMLVIFVALVIPGLIRAIHGTKRLQITYGIIFALYIMIFASFTWTYLKKYR